MSTKLTQRLSEIQKKLNAPKGQFNSFGKYNYRSCEDILMAVKPLLEGLALTINDEIILVADRIYVKATACISDGETAISASAFAREAEDKKGMDSAQVTGSTSSYARKYALNGLLLIDDNKDADHCEHGQSAQKSAALSESRITDLLTAINDAKTGRELKAAYEIAESAAGDDSAAIARFVKAIDAKKAKALAASNAAQA